MNTVNVNLARKWRSRNFDQVIGQDLSLRILKNSLYLDHYFPVYLFSGQHGCGKTTMARIFAAAVNCEQLNLFQQDPKKYSVPCLECTSCKAMSAGNHPDFIEIDGASHTGVDNVRHIIDVAAFLPLLGRKKVYLIDEAHMLSKAAFNAFLKILEEPPASVLFILATTELHKIIDTVRSRSFHLFFRSVAPQVLVQHLENMCENENIAYDKAGLVVIAQQTKGSVRDAINMLEQVRFESNRVTKRSVLEVIGHVDDELLVRLLEKIIAGNSGELLLFISDNALDSLNTSLLWKSLTEVINACIWVIYDLAPGNFSEYQELLTKLVKNISLAYCNDCLKLLYEYEGTFVKTGTPWQLFEMVLLAMCSLAAPTKHQPSSLQSTTNKKRSDVLELNVAQPNPLPQLETEAPKKSKEVPNNERERVWNSFIGKVEIFDPLLSSIFKQGRYAGFDEGTSTLTLLFAKEFAFFNEMLESSAAVWKPLLASLIGKTINVNAVFQEGEQRPAVDKVPLAAQPHKQESAPAKPEYRKIIEKKVTPDQSIDTADKEQWKKATLLKTMFSGTIQELPKGSDE